MPIRVGRPCLRRRGRFWPEKDEDNTRYQAVIRSLERAGVPLDVFAAIACNDAHRVASILQVTPKAGSQELQAGLPAIHVAVILDRREIVKLLLDKGCDPNVGNQCENFGYKGETALGEAASWGRLEVAEMLIKHGANVNAMAERDITPLHEAVNAGHVELVRLLLQNCADANAKDNKQHTLRDGLNADDDPAEPEIAELLRKYGGGKATAGGSQLPITRPSWP